MKWAIRRHRESWRPILDAEVDHWQQKPWRQLISELEKVQAYQTTFGDKEFQVEVNLLENTDTYVHVCVSVDDGELPGAFWPLSTSFIRNKQEGQRPTTEDRRPL